MRRGDYAFRGWLIALLHAVIATEDTSLPAWFWLTLAGVWAALAILDTVAWVKE